MKYISNSPQETAELARTIALKLKKGSVVCLDGELGAGKTTFSAALCAALGVTEQVYSPTYTIINRYDGDLPVYHIDTYRIEDSSEMYEIGFEECLDAGICIIEWSDMIKEILPADAVRIRISKNIGIHEDYREIEVTGI